MSIRPRLPIYRMLPVLLLLLAIHPAAQEAADSSTSYFRSNDLGMALERIEAGSREEFDFILAVESRGRGQTRTLFREGVELRRWESEPGEERIFSNSQLEQRSRYDEEGRLLEEHFFERGKFVRRTLYLYNGEALGRSETYGPEGRVEFVDRYYLSPDGRLRRVVREWVEGPADQQLALGGAAGSVFEERYGNAGQRRINRFDAAGRIVEQELWVDGELTEREHFQYRGQSELLESSRLEQLQLQCTTRRGYDQQGRIIRIEVEQAGEESMETLHRRDDQGRIVETTRRGPEGIENWLFAYDSEGELLREEYRIRGSLERVTQYHSEEQSYTRIEQLYRENELFMRVYYEGQSKSKEEFLKNGEILHVREFE